MTEPPDKASDLELGPPDPALLRRLMAEVESLPLRYAPFFDRLAELFDLSESEVEALLARARDERLWRRTVFPGVRRLKVRAGPALRDAEVYLMRFEPGLRIALHRHRGVETSFVLEGGYVDTHGTRVGPGERQDMPDGSQHGLTVDAAGPCVAAVVTRGADFSGPLLRALARLSGWWQG